MSSSQNETNRGPYFGLKIAMWVLFGVSTAGSITGAVMNYMAKSDLAKGLKDGIHTELTDETGKHRKRSDVMIFGLSAESSDGKVTEFNQQVEKVGNKLEIKGDKGMQDCANADDSDFIGAWDANENKITKGWEKFKEQDKIPDDKWTEEQQKFWQNVIKFVGLGKENGQEVLIGNTYTILKEGVKEESATKQDIDQKASEAKIKKLEKEFDDAQALDNKRNLWFWIFVGAGALAMIAFSVALRLPGADDDDSDSDSDDDGLQRPTQQVQQPQGYPQGAYQQPGYPQQNGYQQPGYGAQQPQMGYQQ
jgi:hypothetical protein